MFKALIFSKLPIKMLAGIFLITSSFLFLRTCRQWEIVKHQSENLSLKEISSDRFPWAKFAGKISSVKNYREAFDIDSNDWIAEFVLLPKETQEWRTLLIGIKNETKYLCYSSLANWEITIDICSIQTMNANGFIGYINSSTVWWINESTGQSFIVGFP